MYNSTKDYVKRCVKRLMDQCGITVWEIQDAIDEMKGYLDVEEFYRDDD
jgi:hypothetical protein